MLLFNAIIFCVGRFRRFPYASLLPNGRTHTNSQTYRSHPTSFMHAHAHTDPLTGLPIYWYLPIPVISFKKISLILLGSKKKKQMWWCMVFWNGTADTKGETTTTTTTTMVTARAQWTRWAMYKTQPKKKMKNTNNSLKQQITFFHFPLYFYIFLELIPIILVLSTAYSEKNTFVFFFFCQQQLIHIWVRYVIYIWSQRRHSKIVIVLHLVSYEEPWHLEWIRVCVCEYIPVHSHSQWSLYVSSNTHACIKDLILKKRLSGIKRISIDE